MGKEKSVDRVFELLDEMAVFYRRQGIGAWKTSAWIQGIESK